MKIQGLAVLAMVIIIPMSIILNVYSSYQIKTLDLQIQYDNRLTSATYDGIKTFQMNMSNSDTDEIVTSKIRDMGAAVKTFFSSLGSNFDMAGYGEEVLQEYVPAIVFTLYDGYYIYTSYNNHLERALDDTQNEYWYNDGNDATYKANQELYGFKPYVYYSCRYKPDPESDFVITYSLDNYITIQGKINGESVNDSGYMLSKVGYSGGKYTYNGVEIVEENGKEGLKQKVYVPNPDTDDEIYDKEKGKRITVSYIEDGEEKTVETGRIFELPYNKINGTKYYDAWRSNIVYYVK